MAMSLVLVLLVQLYMANLSLTTTSSSNITDLSALLAFKSELKSNPNNVLGSNWTEIEAFSIGLGYPVATEDNE